jgi:hypothetical protein
MAQRVVQVERGHQLEAQEIHLQLHHRKVTMVETTVLAHIQMAMALAVAVEQVLLALMALVKTVVMVARAQLQA